MPNSFSTGRRAEAIAAAFLQQKGCSIVAQNWRTRYCEIDIIAERDGIFYFCEVKYRLRATQGSGLEYITPKKIRQMQFAAELWITKHAWKGECQLSAIEISGADFRVTKAVADIS